jgi:hypothetical protein
MRKLHTSLVLPVLVLAFSLPTFAQVQREEAKHPPVSGEGASSGKPTHPPTKQMDKASAPEKTGVPSPGTNPGERSTHPPTKQMDKAASPYKSDK